jgi:hypothetical protein
MVCLREIENSMSKTNLMLMACSLTNLLLYTKFGLMKLAVVKKRKICFNNVVGMRNLCMHNAKKLENVWVQLICCPLLLRISFPREPPSLIMIVWFLLFTANIQNQRKNLGMMTTTMVLFTFLIPLLLQISKMRELDQILFLRETDPSRLMRELLYPLPQILDDGPVVQLASILLLGGFKEQMEEWSVSISVSLDT